ncbi:MAG: hypothetical protein MZW92_05715 [Comamonadaceae bacterium]|nr:hypothetical protein [Comamonadaceae bacterium]
MIRHPMPYGDLAREAVQRFATPGRPRRRALHGRGARGVRAAPGGRQRGLRRRRLRAHRRRGRGARPTSSCGTAATTTSRSSRPDLHVVLVDPLRPGHEATPPPGRGGAAHGRRRGRGQDRRGRGSRRRSASSDNARRHQSARRRSCAPHRPSRLDDPRRPCAAGACWWSRTGPTTTHGGMAYGAGYVAATRRRRGARSSIRARSRRRRSPRVYRAVSAHRPGAAGDGLQRRSSSRRCARRSTRRRPTSWSPPRRSISPR